MQNLWTRRSVLRSAAAFAAVGLAAPHVALATPVSGDVFVFESPHTERLIVALITSPAAASASPANVRLHVGERAWTIDAALNAERADGDDRLFTGSIVGRMGDRLNTYDAVVLETGIARNGDETLGVWAERVDSRERRRFGNPVIAEVTANDPLLAALHTSAQPDDDLARLTKPFADRIALIANRAGNGSSRSHGLRVAHRFLPDVVHYHHGRPIGFTFAAQNGRHPNDDIKGVTATILTGRPAVSRPAARFRMTEAFPYFPLPALAG